MALIEVRLRPSGPWRTGYRGDRERVDVVYHSDTLFSAVTHAMRALGWLEEWLSVTAGATGEPAVRLGSFFPFVGKTRLIAPPKSVWPPSGRGQLHLSGATLVPLEVLRQGLQDESRWEVDGECQCLLPANGSAPFRIVVRESAAVDRLTGVADGHKTACLEFAQNAGFWGVFSATDKVWESRVKSALRLLADSGFGGERSRGWGRSAEPQFNDASHLFPAAGEDTAAWWLLSLYSPDDSDSVDWAKSESSVTVRGGWTDSSAGVALKKQVRLVEEGSVLAASSLRGRAVDVAPEGFAHPVYRAGFALAVPVPVPVEAATKKKPVAAPFELPPLMVPEPVETGVAPAVIAVEPESVSIAETVAEPASVAADGETPATPPTVETASAPETDVVAESSADAIAEPESVATDGELPATPLPAETASEPETEGVSEPSADAVAEPESIASPGQLPAPSPTVETASVPETDVAVEPSADAAVSAGIAPTNHPDPVDGNAPETGETVPEEAQA